jgi:diaminopimelate epimerase
MVYFNSDGNQSTMCGNGGRCSIRFAHDLGMITQKTPFRAIDGLHEGAIAEDGRIHLKMIDTELAIDKEDGYFINTGSPHHIAQVNAVKNVNVFKEGKEIRWAYGEEGTNVNFVEVEENGLHMRTYERGVEDETLSCGTGVTAAALTAFQKGWITTTHIPVRTKGGNLEVRFAETETGFKNVWLIGPTAFVFKGEIEVDA